jgi:hypothetical protein
MNPALIWLEIFVNSWARNLHSLDKLVVVQKRVLRLALAR